MKKSRLLGLVFASAASFMLVTNPAKAISVLIVDAAGHQPYTELQNTGLFDKVDYWLDVESGHTADHALPVISDLTPYDSVLFFSNNGIDSPDSLGNVLADYVDQGGGLVLTNYAFHPGIYGLGGRIMTAGYSPFVNTKTADVSGNLSTTIQEDPIFSGIDFDSLIYFHNLNFSDPDLDSNATLLATDGNGVNMIARNDVGSIVGFNMYAGSSGPPFNNQEFYNLLGNALVNVNTVPTPPAVWLFGSGLLGLIGLARHKRR